MHAPSRLLLDPIDQQRSDNRRRWLAVLAEVERINAEWRARPQAKKDADRARWRQHRDDDYQRDWNEDREGDFR